MSSPSPIELSEEQKRKIQENLENAKRIRLAKSTATADKVQEAKPFEVSRRGGFFASAPSEKDPLPSQSSYTRTRDEPDPILAQHFSIKVCKNCREKHADAYRLMTKTAVKESYLLTEEELADTAVLPFMTKPNPYKSSWSDMQLYLACQVEKFAVEKWGSLDDLHSEIERRDDAKEAQKEKKFKKKLKDLRTKTRSKAKSLSPNAEKSHVHCFKPFGESKKRCDSCGLEIEEEDL